MGVILLRTAFVYAVIIAAMRLMGKRQLGDLELSELVVTVLVADVGVMPIEDPDLPLLYGIAPLLVLFALEYLLSVVAMHSVRLRVTLFGKPSVIIENGRILQREMRRNRFTPEELLQELRNQGIEDLSTVARAVLETSGQLNVILRAEHQPVSAKTLGITPPDAGRFTAVISDGRVLSENLRGTGRDRRWLDRELARHGAEHSTDVYLLLLSENGTVYFAAKEA
ncbi:MAG: DUF421 domain-containing protein [Oscillospiraceae bacterium]|nr:DUF421 domain-containing protein [Oscillospiraceae bacterium]